MYPVLSKLSPARLHTESQALLLASACSCREGVWHLAATVRSLEPERGFLVLYPRLIERTNQQGDLARATGSWGSTPIPTTTISPGAAAARWYSGRFPYRSIWQV